MDRRRVVARCQQDDRTARRRCQHVVEIIVWCHVDHVARERPTWAARAARAARAGGAACTTHAGGPACAPAAADNACARRVRGVVVALARIAVRIELTGRPQRSVAAGLGASEGACVAGAVLVVSCAICIRSARGDVAVARTEKQSERHESQRHPQMACHAEHLLRCTTKQAVCQHARRDLQRKKPKASASSSSMHAEIACEDPLANWLRRTKVRKTETICMASVGRSQTRAPQRRSLQLFGA